ncbi:hypothetical protein GGER_08790 [Serratia rubidaea]
MGTCGAVSNDWKSAALRHFDYDNATGDFLVALTKLNITLNVVRLAVNDVRVAAVGMGGNEYNLLRAWFQYAYE